MRQRRCRPWPRVMCALMAATVSLACALSIGTERAWGDAEATHLVTVTVEGHDGTYDPIEVEDHACVGYDPTEQLDEEGTWPLKDLADAMNADHRVLTFHDAETGDAFDWMETPVTSDRSIVGSWEQLTGYEVTVVYDDDDDTEVSRTIPFGQSWHEATGAIPGTPTKKGHTFEGWLDAETEQPYDFDGEVTGDTVVIADWDLADVDEVAYDASSEPPKEIKGTCRVNKAWLGAYTSWGSHCYFSCSKFSGYLKGQSGVAVCVDPGSASQNSGTFTYKATRTSWNETTGKVSYEVLITPGKSPCTGKLYTKNKKGHQRAIVKMTFTRQMSAHVRLVKSSTDKVVSASCDYYDLAGATYEVTNAKGSVVCRLTTDSSGKTNVSKALPNGTYTYRETKAAKGYELDRETHTIKVSHAQATDGVQTFSCADVPYTPLRIAKASLNPTLSEGNDCYDLTGATYEVTDADGTVVATLVTNAKGTTPISTPLPKGSYRIREVKAAPGFELDRCSYGITVSNEEADDAGIITFSCSDRPASDKGKLIIAKVDKETRLNLPLSGATLTGALFEVRYFAGQFATLADAEAADVLTHTWTFSTDEEGTIVFDEAHLASGDKLPTDEMGNPCLPLGTYAITETKAPVGYNLDDATQLRHVTQNDDTTADGTFGAVTLPEQVKRGDAHFTKCDAQSQARMAGVPFLVTAASTGETHVIVTDANGYWSSEASYNPHTQSTNHNDEAVSDVTVSQDESDAWHAKTDGVTVDETKLSSEAGCWFGQDAKGNRPDPDDDLGALPYDRYTFVELRTSANEGKELVSFELEITRHGYHVDLGTVTDDATYCYLATTATDTADGDKMVTGSDDASVTDTVEYHGLEPGTTYELEAWLVDKESQEVVTKTTTTFSPEQADGATDVVLPFDGTTIEDDAELVVFEILYRASDHWQVAKHADLNDEGQTVTLTRPAIETTATDQADGDHNLLASKKATIVDTVSYRNLCFDSSGTRSFDYLMEGVLMDKANGKPLEIDGAEVTATASFSTTVDGAGTVEVTFGPFDASDLAGADVVVFETLYERNEDGSTGDVVATHQDITDKGQTVTFVDKKDASPATTKGKAYDKTGASQLLLPAAAAIALTAGLTLIVAGRRSGRRETPSEARARARQRALAPTSPTTPHER